VDDDRLERRFTRPDALRLAAAGAAGIAFGARPAHASSSDVPAVEAAARAFLRSLAAADRARATFSFDGAERTRWHWTIPSSVPRNGLPIGALSREQRRLGLALLRSSSSPAGYRKAVDIMALQGVLQRMTTGLGDAFDADRYYVSIFGSPGARVWGWRFEGHHLSRHFTIVGNQLVAEPFFLGAWPTRAGSAYRSIATGERTMPREEDAAREIVLSLDGALRRRVVFSSESLTDHLTQNAVRVRPLERVGVRVEELPSAAQRRVLEIVRTYLANHPPALERAGFARVQRAGLGRAWFGWAGSTRPGVPQYYRLQGPTFLLEFDNSRNSGTHIHSVWRDFERDFGSHLL
jgi:Protein of unknown function (DUF3500)